MRTGLALIGWVGVVALVYAAAFSEGGLFMDPGWGTAGLGLLGAAAVVRARRNEQTA